MRVEGLRFGVEVSGSKVQSPSSGFKMKDSGFRIWGVAVRDEGLECRL